MWMHWFGFLAALPRGMYDLSAPITVQFVHPKIKTVQTICKNMEKRRIECCSHLQRTYHGGFASPVARGWCWSRHLCFLSTLSCAATRPHYMSPLVANIRLITFNLTLKLRGFSKYFDSYMGPVEHKIWWENGWKVGQEVSGVEFGIFPSDGVTFGISSLRWLFIWFCYSSKQLGLVLVYLHSLKKQILLSWTVLPFKTGKFGNSIIISKYILLLTKT